MVVRLGYFAMIDHNKLANGDTPAYEGLSTQIRNGDAYESSAASGLGGFPAGLTRPPGYPTFLAALGSNPRQHRTRTAIAQIILSSLMSVAIALLAALLFSPPVGIVAGVAYALDWTTLVHVPLAIADSMFAIPVGLGALMLALALMGDRTPRRLLAGAGVLLGIACLVKPAAQIMVVGLAVLLVIVARPRRRALVFVLAVAVIAVPWAVRNDGKYHVLTLSPISTANLYFQTALGTYGYRSPLHTDLDALGHYVGLVDAQWYAKRLSPPDRVSELQRLARTRIEHNLPKVLDQAVIGLARTSFGTGAQTIRTTWPDSSAPSSLITTWLPLLELVILWALVAIGTVWAWMTRVVPRRVTACLVLALLLALIPAATPGGYARFRTPAAPMMAVLAAVGVQALWQLRARRYPPRGATAPALPPR